MRTASTLLSPILLLLLLLGNAGTAHAQQNVLRLYDANNPSGKVFRTIYPGYKLRVYLKQGADNDDYFSTRQGGKVKGIVAAFEDGSIVFRDGQVVKLEDVEALNNLSAGRMERILTGVIFVGSLGLSIVGLTTADPWTGALIFVTSLLGYPVAGFTFAMGMLSDSKRFELGDRWRAEIVPQQ